MFDATEYWITIVELPEFERDVPSFLSAEETEGLITFLSCHPDDGLTIENTGGIRQITWPATGKSGGKANVFYFYRDLNVPVYLLGVIGVNDPVELSEGEKAEMRALTTAIVASRWIAEVEPKVRSSIQSGL